MFFQKRADNTEAIILPNPPYVFPPSGDFDGNDGKWSTFTVNIGDDETGRGQNFKVLISTSSPLTLVPRGADWCDDDECAEQRGIELFNAKQPRGFESSLSAAWNEAGLYSIPVPDWWTGTEPNGTWGSDNVGLGPSDPKSLILGSQWVVEHDFQELFMGSFGLAAGAVSIGSGAAKLPFLSNFAAANQTPSTSYGYTAGAVYQNNSKGIPGNLVLGGFDQSRFRQQGTSILMPSAANNSLIVGVYSILYHNDANDFSFTSETDGFSATIDSTLPYLYLPDAICDKFAESFRLQFDNATELYILNDTAHEYNRQQNATVTFTIGDGLSNILNTTTITLPYDAFNLQAASPIYAEATNYFPIKKSKNGLFVLGRTFLQETYIIVDYERANFTVAQAAYSDPMPEEQIVSIFKKDYVPPAATNTPSPTSSKKGLARGALVGIAVGTVIVVLCLVLGAFFFWKKRRALKKEGKAEIPEIDTTAAGTEVKPRRVSELDTDTQGKPVGGYYGGGRDHKGTVPFPLISEMESPPAELYSPPPESAQLSASTPGTDRIAGDYFSNPPRRRGATRESSQSNTPGAPGVPGVPAVHELPGDDGQFQVNGLHFDRIESPSPERPVHSRGPSDTSLQTNIDEVISGARPEAQRSASRPTLERRPSHVRGASDVTANSDTTAVTSEEIENWAMGVGTEPSRPLSE